MVNAWFPNWSYPIAESLQHILFEFRDIKFRDTGTKKEYVITSKQLSEMYNIAIDPKNHNLDYIQFMDMFQEKFNLSNFTIIILDSFLVEEIEYCSKNKNNIGYFLNRVKDGSFKPRKRERLRLLGDGGKERRLMNFPQKTIE